jgi:hypothetical protein
LIEKYQIFYSAVIFFFFKFLIIKTLDPEPDGIQPEMLDPDPDRESMNPDPKQC